MAIMKLDELVSQLRAAYGSRLESVVLYGSAAAGEGEHIARKSDYNVLVLLDRVDASTLAAASAVARAWRDAGNPPPMTLTRAEWQRSADIFPMEYSDILERHRVLFGNDPTRGITISQKDLRLQLEQQVMGKLLQLRQGALLAGTDGKRQLELMERSLSTILVLLRSALRLAGVTPPASTADVAALAGTTATFDASAFSRVARHVRGELKITAPEAGVVLGLYLAGVEQLNRWLDTFPTPEGLS